MNSDFSYIGKRIRELRKAKRLSLEKFSEISGVSKTYIANVETNPDSNPSIQKLFMIAKGLGVGIEHLILKEHAK